MNEQPPKIQKRGEKTVSQPKFKEPEIQSQMPDISEVPAGQITHYLRPPIEISPSIPPTSEQSANQDVIDADFHEVPNVQIPLPPLKTWSEVRFNVDVLDPMVSPFESGLNIGSESAAEGASRIAEIQNNLEFLKELLLLAERARQDEYEGRIIGMNAELNAVNFEMSIDEILYNSILNQKVLLIEDSIRTLEYDLEDATKGLKPIPTPEEQNVLERNRARDLPQGPIKKALDRVDRIPRDFQAALGGIFAALVVIGSANLFLHNTPTGKTISGASNTLITELLDARDQFLNPFKSVVTEIDPRLETKIRTIGDARKLQVFYKTPNQPISASTRSRIAEVVDIKNLRQMPGPRTVDYVVEYEPETGILTITLETPK